VIDGPAELLPEFFGIHAPAEAWAALGGRSPGLRNLATARRAIFGTTSSTSLATAASSVQAARTGKAIRRPRGRQVRSSRESSIAPEETTMCSTSLPSVDRETDTSSVGNPWWTAVRAAAICHERARGEADHAGPSISSRDDWAA